MTEKQMNALRCAIAVLDGSAGGYTANDKYAAKLELMAMLVREEQK